jgi:ubiquinone/menaquinone biosynthesis C-methylase UbiE
MSSKDYFDEVANQWDSMRQSFFSEEVRVTALAKAGVKAGQLAADIGAGSGFISEALLGAKLKVIAVDQSEDMLTVMKEKFGESAVDYRAGGSEALPIEDNSVDYAFANMYLHHVEAPALAIKEMVRILRPDGQLIITDLDSHDFAFLVEEHHDRWLGFERDLVSHWFTEAGLSHVEVGDVGCDCCTTSECGTCDASIGIFIAAGRKV